MYGNCSKSADPGCLAVLHCAKPDQAPAFALLPCPAALRKQGAHEGSTRVRGACLRTAALCNEELQDGLPRGWMGLNGAGYSPAAVKGCNP